MSEKYIIGVDGGSQTTKVTIFDTKGNIVCEGKKQLKPMHRPELGGVEHPDDDLWFSLIEAGQDAMSKFEGNKEDIIGLGLCSIRFCRVLLKKDGSLAQNVISWMDLRVSSPYVHENPEVAYVVTTNGYMTHRLTGQFRDMTSSYQGEWPIDTDTWQWSEDPKVFEHYNIPREMLFDLCEPGAILGNITPEAAKATGFPVGLPVVSTGNDKAVEALGAGLKETKTALFTLGTYIACMMPGWDNPKGTQNYWTNFACIPHQYLYESYGVRRGMWAISWWRDILGEEAVNKAKALGISPEEYLNSLAKDISAGSDGLITIPEFLPPPNATYKRGIMIGFDARHTAGHVYRSIMEAIALTIKNKTDVMCEEVGVKLEKLVVSGGGSSSDVFMQIIADVFGIPTERNVVNSSAGMGAAICVAVASGVYDSFDTAIKEMVRIKDRFTPVEENVKLYKRLNETVYRDVTKETDSICQKLQSVFE